MTKLVQPIELLQVTVNKKGHAF